MLLHGSTYPQFFIPTANAKNRLIPESGNEVKGGHNENNPFP